MAIMVFAWYCIVGRSGDWPTHSLFLIFLLLACLLRLCTCAKYWLSAGVNNAVELLLQQQQDGSDDKDHEEGAEEANRNVTNDDDNVPSQTKTVVLDLPEEPMVVAPVFIMPASDLKHLGRMDSWDGGMSSSLSDDEAR
jgi:hypothetical protein